MPNELDQWRVAQQLIDRHGVHAEDQALDRVERAHDQEARDLWMAIFHKIKLCG